MLRVASSIAFTARGLAGGSHDKDPLEDRVAGDHERCAGDDAQATAFNRYTAVGHDGGAWRALCGQAPPRAQLNLVEG